MSTIAIITARGGSKRIPKKNIRDFLGLPIISYSIKAALESKLFDIVMVSTDSEEIAEIAIKYGAEVPFMRSEKTSNDYADTSDVLLEVLDKYKEMGIYCEQFCCIYPTAPFITPQKLIESRNLLTGDVHNVVPMVVYSFPPQRGMKKDNGFVVPAYPEYINYRSQDLDEIYHDCGQFYWCNTEAFRENQNILFNNTLPYVISEMEVQDIDNETDWKLAEVKYQFMKRK